MLVITRKSTERIVIGDDVEVVVLSLQGQRVKLGIVAAAEKRISRLDSAEKNRSTNGMTCRIDVQMPLSPQEGLGAQRDGRLARLS